MSSAASISASHRRPQESSMPPGKDLVTMAGEHARAARQMQDTHQLPFKPHRSSLPPASHLAITSASPEQHAKGKDIACLAHHAVDQELRGHVSYRAHCLCAQLTLNVQLTAEPKVCNLQASAVCVSSARVLLAGPAPRHYKVFSIALSTLPESPGRQLLLSTETSQTPCPLPRHCQRHSWSSCCSAERTHSGKRHTASAVQRGRNRSRLLGRRTACQEDPTHTVSASLGLHSLETEAANATNRSAGASGLLQCCLPSKTHLGRQPDRACCRGAVHQQNITAGEVLQSHQPSSVVPQPHSPTMTRSACVPEMEQCLGAAHLPACR